MFPLCYIARLFSLLKNKKEMPIGDPLTSPLKSEAIDTRGSIGCLV